MRYQPEHKQETRRRILDAAARLFRRRGYHGVGINGIMEAADLTRGGFYGHFESKEALFAEVMGLEQDFKRRLEARQGSSSEELRRGTLRIATDYLTPAHREAIARGCHLATLSIDVARADATARQAFTERIEELLVELMRGIERPPEEARLRAQKILSACVGGIVLSRALAGDGLRAEVTRGCVEEIARQLDLEPQAREERA